MGSKRNKPSKGENESGGGGEAEEGKQMITDPRFSSAHTDPRFRRVPRRESKVTLDSRFKGVLTDKASAPVDKRGKRRRRGSGKDSLKEYYRIEDGDKKKQKRKRKEDSEDESGDESEGEQELMALKAEAERRKTEQSIEEESKAEKKLTSQLASSDEESDEGAESEEEDSEDVSEEEEEEDTDEDDEAMYEDDGPEIAEENITNIEKETHRLAIVNMDWRYVSAKDLFVVFNSFLPKDGRLLSVAVYPTEFGLERMKEEEVHGPAIDGDKKNEDNGDEDDDEEEEEEEDEDVTNERLRDYEKSRLKYYFAVAECDSSATADYLYKSCDGIEFERSSNKLDLRFIPDSMEFKHPPRDISTEAPANYQGLDFQSQALQLSKVHVTWDEDEPHRVKTLNQKFNPDQLADLELKEFLASDESESEDDDERRKETYRALMEAGGVDSDKDEEEENDQDMEVTFNTGLEDLSKKILEKKDKKSETLWEAHLREKREKKRTRRMKQKDDSSSPDDDDDDDDDDDYNVDKKKKKKNKKGLEEKVAADERSIAELELIVADENGGDGKGLKGYNIKGKGKKRSKEMAEEKIPSADPDDPRFSAAFTDPDYALDPTNPQFKRSATYVKQIAQKQKDDPRSHEQGKATETKASTTDGGMVGSKKRTFAESATVKSLKLKMQQKSSEKKKEGTAELAQRVKNKAKALSKK